MRVLCVAEKPSIARSITGILSGGQYDTRPSRNKFIKNFDFNYPQTNSFYTVTSVSGHLMEHDFGANYKNWQSCDPFVLFDAPVEERVASGSKTIEENLKNEARRAEMLMIWTDCDREGENIGAEVAKICRKSNPRIRVKRARFSAIIPQQIHNAAQHPVELDQAQADAVEARTILDLRLGAAFTRMQTLILQRRFAQIQDAGAPVSYGPCQFPTLGFVVSRFEQVRSFSPETFWYIYLSLSRPASPGKKPVPSGKKKTEPDETTEFSWKRVRLFDFDAASAIYEAVMDNPLARVTKKTSKPTKKWKPLPLTTVELQKAGSRLLRLAPKKVLDIAEKLYQQGFLSYPRTETDQYDPQFDFMTLVGKQTTDPSWGPFAAQLQQGGFQAPRKGKKNDKAHPPIHPTAYAGNLAGDEKKVYEFVTRRFLASCSKDAEGQETTVDVLCGGEHFSATGLIVLERNYLEVYVYDKWVGKYLPDFEEGEQFMPSICELREGQTTCPNLLTEADLVGLMDKNGIGTDATIAQHIQTIADRGYVLERMEGSIKYLVPSTLGIGLVEGYNEIGFDKSLSKPQLRRDTEKSMVEVCERTKSKDDMLLQSIEQYKEVFIKAKREFDKVIASVGRHIEGGGQNGAPSAQAGVDGGRGGGGGRGRGGGRGGGEGGGGGRGDDAPGDDNQGGGAARGSYGGRGRQGENSSNERPPNSATTSRPPPRVPANASPQNPPPNPPPPRAAALSSRTQSLPFPASSLAVTSTPSVTHSTNVKCKCNKAAGERTVVKEGPNKGRKFWTCGDNSNCDYFEWADGPSTGSTATTRTSSLAAPPTRRTAPERSHSDSYAARNIANGSSRRCKCDMTAVQKAVVREGANQGRKFWICPNNEKARCGFFEWDDDNAGSSDVSSNVNTYSHASGGSQTGECYKCGEPGHWANSCVNAPQSQGVRKRTISMASANTAGGSSSTACFKCGQEGHYSSSCTNAPKSTSRSQDAPSGNACFKCGEVGHFSSACPNGESGSKFRNQVTTKRGRARGGSTSRGSTKRTKSKSRFSAADGF